LTDWAFDHLGLDRVIIDREPTNRASARVAEKLGARETGVRMVEYQGFDVELIRYVVLRPGG
jgi:RimJ/RimL family protein N-acetyltransferase